MPSFAGAVILSDLKKTLIFKNRDMRKSSQHIDGLFYDIDCFGVRGIDKNTGTTAGLAIGVNRFGLAIANTNVMKTSDPSYTILTEQLLMFAKDAEDGLSMTVDQLEKNRSYQWGNLVLADDDSMLVIELAGNDHSIEWSERRVLRTGHHIMLDTEQVLRDEGYDYERSVKRVERGYDLIRRVTKVEDVFSLLRDHGEAPGQESLCCHSTGEDDYSTVMSYLIEVDHNTESGKPRIVFHVAKGNPCNSEFTAIPILFPADEEIMNRAVQLYPK
jgi:hypothetical protein